MRRQLQIAPDGEAFVEGGCSQQFGDGGERNHRDGLAPQLGEPLHRVLAPADEDGPQLLVDSRDRPIALPLLGRKVEEGMDQHEVVRPGFEFVGDDTDLGWRAVDAGAARIYVDGARVRHAVLPRSLPRALR